MAARFLLLTLAVVLVHGLYEEPPGGCGAPPDDDAFAAPPKLKKMPTPQQKQPAAAAVKTPEELEKELYEQEAMAAMQGLGAGEIDWEAVEMAKINDDLFKILLTNAAFVVGLLYALYKVLKYSSAKREQFDAAQDGKTPAAAGDGNKKADATATSPAADEAKADKPAPASAAAAPAPTEAAAAEAAPAPATPSSAASKKKKTRKAD